MSETHQTITGNSNIFSGTGEVKVIYNLPPAEAETHRNLLILLDKVKKFWVEGVLDKSIHHAVLIELGKELRPENIEHPWERVLELPEQNSQTLPPEKKIDTIFDEVERVLLILGEPGSGKTITLLELARTLITRAENDPSQPIPVVFNLSSWAENREPLIDWMISELKNKYFIPKKFRRAWLENQRILPLLDGLDEVKAEYRAACLDAINAFAQEFGLNGLVVCSRLKEYTDLPARLKFNGAICLQPLTPEQINNYLGTDSKFMALHSLLQQDHNLQTLAKSPLMLNVMTLAYQDLPVETVSSEKFDTLEERRTHLFNTYIERMFQRKGKAEQPYTKNQVIDGLSWLAQRMKQHAQNVFMIENLQPSWLKDSWLVWFYVLSSRMIAGLVIGLTIRLSDWLAGILITYEHILWGLYWMIAGFIVGILDVLRFKRNKLGSKETFTVLNIIANVLIYGLVIGIIPAIAAGLSEGIISTLVNGLSSGLTDGWFSGLGTLVVGGILGMIYGLIFGIRNRTKTLKDDIKTVEVFHWSWSHIKKNNNVPWFLFGFVFYFIFVFIIGFFESLDKLEWNISIFWIIFKVVFISLGVGLSGGLIVGLISAIFSGLKISTIETKNFPNQGIKLTLKNTILIGIIIWLIISLCAVLINGISMINLSMGLPIALLVSLWYGGLDIIQHYTLRFILYFKGYMPYNPIRFLDNSVKLVFLQKIGGSYKFIHNLLLEHFAEINDAKEKLRMKNNNPAISIECPHNKKKGFIKKAFIVTFAIIILILSFQKIIVPLTLKWHHFVAEQGDVNAQINLGFMYYNGRGVTQDFQESIKWYRMAAEQGSAIAQGNLGIMYQNGQGVEQDYQKALNWFRLAAEQGSVFAQGELGTLYRNGQGVEQDYQKALNWFRLAAEQGSTFAQGELGTLYRNGQGVEQDYQKALKWYHLAAEQGDVIAQGNLGFMYQRGQGVEQDYQEALKWFHLAAEQEDAPAQRNLGVMYQHGYGVPQNYQEAIKWYRKAAEQGYIIAQYSMGVMYQNGYGVEPNYQKALKLYSIAAEQENTEAQGNLGVMYFKGQGVKQDFQMAFKWFYRAAKHGNVTSQRNLGIMYQNGQGVEQNYQEALKWYRLAAEQEDAQAQRNLGVMYELGYGVTQNYQEAIKWYRKAAEQGYVIAQYSMGVMYQNGYGVEQNYQKALKLYSIATEQGNTEAQGNLGVMYFNGQGVKQDFQVAFKWFYRAANQGNVSSQRNLGIMYQNGQGVEQNYQEAINWYRQAAEQGDAFAQAELGTLYRNGQGVEQNYQEAIKWYIAAATQDDAQAQENLGLMYQYGQGVKPDYQEAIKWFRMAAKQGDAIAQGNLGFMYQYGQGVEQNYQEAIKWYHLAAKQGNSDAQMNLVFIYYFGQGVIQNYQEAIKWCRIITETGNHDVSFFCLGQIEELEKKLDKALSWYKKINGSQSYLHYLQAQRQIAIILAEQGNLDKALEHLHTIPVESEEDELLLVRFEVELLTMQKQYAEALAICDKVIKTNPNNTEFLFQRAFLLEKKQRFDKSELDLRRVLEINPQHANALNFLGYMLANHTDRYQEAYDFLKQALHLQPNSPYILDSIGWVLYRMGKYPEAIEYLRQAQAKTDNSMPAEAAAETAVHLGEVLWVSGDKPAAKEVWEKARQDFPDYELLHEVWQKFVTPQISIEKIGVATVAAYLAEMGYFTGNIRHAKLEEVQNALKSFQRDLKMAQTGQLDDVTWGKLKTIKLNSARKAELEALQAEED